MGRGGQGQVSRSQVFDWPEVQSHDKYGDRWLVLDGQVYDVSEWANRHPGGSRLIAHYSGQDASEAFNSFHKNMDHVQKFLKPLKIGTLKEYKKHEIDEDFNELRKTAHKMGLFESSKLFYALHLGHIIALDLLAYFVLWYYGTGWLPCLASLLMQATAQSQDGWLQHDFGHISVFKSLKWDHLLHYFTMGFIKGASPHWWNHMHYQHHSKPNVISKDPDVRIDALFVVGDVMPREVAKKRKKSPPFNLQHRYFFAVGPPLLYPIYFQFMTIRHIIIRRLWKDISCVGAFYVKYLLLYVPLLGLPWTIVLYFFSRVLESHWFTWVSQSNHIPMNIRHEEQNPWLKLQINATCDIEQSFFNDWFTGHLNFQIEHHLFPTMPRHNLYKVAPLVKSLCEKHHVPYVVKPLWTAFCDIVKSLKHSGELWEEAYHEFHH